MHQHQTTLITKHSNTKHKAQPSPSSTIQIELGSFATKSNSSDLGGTLLKVDQPV